MKVDTFLLPIMDASYKCIRIFSIICLFSLELLNNSDFFSFLKVNGGWED